MPTEIHNMQMAKAPLEEWEKVMKFVQDLEVKVERRHWTDPRPTDADLGAWVRENMPPMMRTVYGYRVLVDNCCDPDVDHLAFKPELAALIRADNEKKKRSNMTEPTKCPECGALQGHSPRCSLIGFEEAKEQLKLYSDYFQKFEKRFWKVRDRLSKDVTDWQGRHALLRAENNALRRQLYPPKKKV